MSKFSKEFLSVDQQIATLRDRGMLFNDDKKARLCLSRIGYYRLSAYWYPFRELRAGPLAVGAKPSSLRSDFFIQGTTFEEVHDFYVFDKRLRLLLTDALERIEISLRASLSDQMASSDFWAHRTAAALDGKFARNLDPKTGQTKHDMWLRRQDHAFARSKEDFAVHFRTKYPDHQPPMWIASQVWDWGMLSHLFAGLKVADKDDIAKRYGPINGRQMEDWLRSLNDVRNICAHHGRLWNRALVMIPRLPDQQVCPELRHIPKGNEFRSKLYVVLAIVRMLLKAIHPNNSKWHARLLEILREAPGRDIINHSAAGFPQHWEAEELWRD